MQVLVDEFMASFKWGIVSKGKETKENLEYGKMYAVETWVVLDSLPLSTDYRFLTRQETHQ